jgi:nitrite reductase/ring-hydroxylating ferredoxin subunit
MEAKKRIPVGAVHELLPGSRRVVEIDACTEALVLNIGGTLYAISNICPHAGAALQRGRVDGIVLYCPLHCWGFSLTTGICLEDHRLRADIYTLEQQDGQLFLHLR